MTEEYKDLLFDYITGQISPTSSSTEEVFIDENISTNNLLSLLPAGTDSYYIYGIVSNNDDTGEAYALYGAYGNGNNSNGFIAILDKDFNITNVITTFSSGTALRPIYALEVNTEDNTFFGVDSNGTNRFIMLNNFTIPNSNNQYEVKLRTSYNFSDNNFYPYCCKIFKNPNTAHYIIVGSLSENTPTIKAIDLIVNVGSSNTWASYTSSDNYKQNAYVDFNSSDNAMIVTLTSTGSVVRKQTKNYTSTSFSGSTVLSTSASLSGVTPVAWISPTKFYYCISLSGVASIYEYNGSNNLIHSETLGTLETYQVKAYNGDIYIYYNAKDGNHSYGQVYYQRYTGTWSPIELTGFQTWTYQADIFIGSKYNLTKIYMYGRIPNRTETCLLTEDYNKTNYNSIPYIDGTSIYPQKARIYSNGDLIFARNEYNISALDNSYTATVEIPNIYLNSGTIEPIQLISKTNKVIVSDPTPLSKNIYEKVYLNFINSITSYDYDTGRTFDTSKLVKSISGTGSSYSQSSIRNWTTTKNGEVVDRGQINNFTKLGRLDGEFYIEFTPTGEADRLNFVDTEDNVHAWIDISNCEVGKTYNIYQKVRLSDSQMELYNVLYNNDIVQYNGNDVLYYGNK